MNELDIDKETTNNRRSSVFFFDDLPKLAVCHGCIVYVPVAHFEKKRNSKFKLFKRKKSEHTLHTVGTCTLMLLEYEYKYPGEIVHFSPEENQTPVLQLDLNRIEQNTLQYVVQESKLWQEFHLNDNGKRRSFVLQFNKGVEFEEFNKKLQSVTELLEKCKDNKLVTNKKYFLVGYKTIESIIVIEEKDLHGDLRKIFSETSFGSDTKLNGLDSQLNGSDSQLNGTDNQLNGSDSQLIGSEGEHSGHSKSSNSCDNNDNFVSPPFSPKPYNTFPQANLFRVTGLDKVLSTTERPRSEESELCREERIRRQIYGSLSEPPTLNSVLKSDDHSFVIPDNLVQPSERIYSSHENGENLKSWEILHSLNITEIDLGDQVEDRSINITDVRGQVEGDTTIKGTNLENFLNLQGTICEKTLKACNCDESVNLVEKQRNIETDLKKFSQGPKFIPVVANDSSSCKEIVNGSDTMKARQELNELKQTAQLLQAAINEGDRENARQYADILASSRVKVAVNVDENSLKTDEQDIKIKVCVEDKESTGASLLLSVKLSDTIGDLKKNMFLRHKFPTEVQKWIVGKRIPKDEETLQRLRVTHGQTVFLYLVSAKSVGLDKKQHMAASGVYVDMTLKEPGVPQIAKPGPQPMNDLNPMPTLKPEVKVERPVRTENQAVIQPKIQPQAEAGGVEVKRPLIQKPKTDSNSVGWQCAACTYLNLPTRPGCEMCSSPRPKDYKIPENYVMSQIELERLQKEKEDERKAQQLEQERQRREAEQSQENFQQLVQADDQHTIPNQEPFDCPICFDRITPGNGVVLRECLHSFCRDCLKGAIIHNEEAFLQCPFQNDNYSCNASLQDREIKALVPEEIYERYLRKSLSTAESQEINSFHCKTPDCQGWCIYEDHVNFFKCMVCKKENCLTCKAIHEGMDCRTYQDDLHAQANNNASARRTKQMLVDMVKKGDAMHCPQCKVILQKKDGCDWIKCSICKTEICWVTKGPRWGPLGPGDTTGGCRCRINGEACHPDCNNCH